MTVQDDLGKEKKCRGLFVFLVVLSGGLGSFKSSEEGSVVLVVHARYTASCCFPCTCLFQGAGNTLARLLR